MTRFVLFVSLLLCAGLCAAQEAPVEAAAPPAPAEAAPTEAPAPEQPPAPVEPVPATPVEAAPVEVPAPEQPPVPAEPAPAAPAEPAAAETPAALETAEAPVETPAPAEQPEYLGHPLGLAAPTGDAVRVPDALFVDAREPEAYAQNHIAGAVNLPAKSLSEERNGVVNLLRPVDQLAALLAQRGITTDRTIIIYGEGDSHENAIPPARVFWVLDYLSFPELHLLDGGLRKWAAEGLPVETGEGSAKPVPVENVKVKIRPEVISRQGEVLELLVSGKGLVVDVRPRPFYLGEQKKDFVARPGHIPKAYSRPASRILDETTLLFKSEEEIQAALVVDGGDTAARVVVYCNSGNEASLGYFGYRLAGYENVALYDGSMAEWSRNPGLALTTEDTEAPAVPAPPAAPAEPAPAEAPAAPETPGETAVAPAAPPAPEAPVPVATPPAAEAPAVETPAAGAPAAETPAVDAPAATPAPPEPPAAEKPAADAPAAAPAPAAPAPETDAPSAVPEPAPAPAAEAASEPAPEAAAPAAPAQP
ncbi:MAG TPA: rhodanese-like domain-containing protein [Candidatus Hydrogenedentes bacterium]|nr:rhodanese-like domain-containing protein [Candidatus Hydrogenedentota bacterium]